MVEFAIIFKCDWISVYKMEQQEFLKLKQYFERQDLQMYLNGELGKSTELGVYLPASLDFTFAAFSLLLKRGMIDTSKPFLDAGSGDGRIIALAASLGIPSMGIEYDGELAELSRENISNLRALSALNGVPVTILQGNFMHPETYRRAGLKFGDIGAVFNYASGHVNLASKVAYESKTGTRFILYCFDTHYSFDGLLLEDVLDESISPSARSDVGTQIMKNHDLLPANIFVYKK